jgi:hypothetical protein
MNKDFTTKSKAVRIVDLLDISKKVDEDDLDVSETE